MKNEVDLLPELRAHVARKYRTQTAAAKALGLSTSFISQVLSGAKSPSTEMLDDAGIERAPVRYVRKAGKKPEGASNG